ncbi:energy-coupling factor ABC transporter ATP-binding protein [candidate division FCPU426 bacterium]|nr:energy-coupling factor ABC transporter ATP-binding protein [candidate division FCPU426 bacterium]
MIKIEELSYQYPDGTRALDAVNLTLSGQSALGIIGANGAGKSTLLSHFNGYYLPQQGHMIVDGLEVSAANREVLRKKVGLVFQHPDDQLFMPRVVDDVMFGPLNLNEAHEALAGRTEELMRFLEIWHLRDRPPFHLSAGEKRFVALAAVLVMRPQVLVMDEPTSDLDPRNRRKLIALINQWQGTKIIASHHLDFVWETCAEVAVLHAGRIVAQGKTQEILSDRELLEQNHLELPLRLQK